MKKLYTSHSEAEHQNDGISGEDDNEENNLITEFKAEPDDIVQVDDDDIRSLYNLLNEDEIHDIDEDCEMVVIKGTIPKPIQVNSDDLMKRENDWFSENIPYNDTVDISLD